MKMKNETFDILKWCAMLLLPALATLVSALGNIWGLSWAPQVSDTIVAVNAALAMVLGISSINYYREEEQG